MINNFLLLFLNLIYLSQQYVNPPYYLTTPQYIISTPILSYLSIKKSQINQNYISRFSSMGHVNIWDIKTGSIPVHLNTLLTSYETKLNNGTVFMDMSLNRNNLLTILSNQTFYILNLTAGVNYVDNISAINGTLRQIQITENDNVLLLTDERQIILFEKPTYSEKYRYNFNINLENISKMAKCQNINSGLIYVAVWDSKANIVLLECNSITCTQKKFFPRPVVTTNWVINHISFNRQCSLMIIQKDTIQGVIIWDVLNNTQKLRINSIYFAIINRIQFYDLLSKYIIVYSATGEILIHDTHTNTFNQSFTFQDNVTEHSFWSDDQKGMFIVHSDFIKPFYLNCIGSLNQYNQCYNCGVCTSPQVCISATGKCGLNTTVTNTTNNITNTTNTTTNLTTNATFLANNSEQFPDKLNSFCQKITHYFILTTKGTVSYSMVFVQISPFIIYFISFINFWTICSLYALIQTNTPEYLNDLLFSIYQAVYASIFQLIGIHLNTDFELQNKFQATYLDNYGISSIFIKNHIQDFFGFGIGFFLLLLIFVFRTLFTKNSYLSRNLKINNSFIILVQFISIAFTFVLSFHLIKNDGFYLKFKQKLNLATYILVSSLSLVISSLVLFPNFLPFEYHKSKGEKPLQSTKQQTVSQLQQKRQIFYNSFSTTFLVLFIMSQSSIITFLGGLVVHLVGIWISKMSKQYRRNKIILSYYLFIFHITYFSLILIIDTDIFNQTIIHTLGLICSSIIIFGAIHQLLFMIYKVSISLYKEYIIIKNLYNNRIKDQQQKNSLKDSKIQGIEQNFKIKQKSYLGNNKLQLFSSKKRQYRFLRNKIKANQDKKKNSQINILVAKNVQYIKDSKVQQHNQNSDVADKAIILKDKYRFKYKRARQQNKDLVKLNNLSQVFQSNRND